MKLSNNGEIMLEHCGLLEKESNITFSSVMEKLLAFHRAVLSKRESKCDSRHLTSNIKETFCKRLMVLGRMTSGGLAEGTTVGFCSPTTALTGRALRLALFSSLLLLGAGVVALYYAYKQSAKNQALARQSALARTTRGLSLSLKRMSMCAPASQVAIKKETLASKLRNVDHLILPIALLIIFEGVVWVCDMMALFILRFLPDAFALAMYIGLLTHVRAIGRPIALYLTSKQYKTAFGNVFRAAFGQTVTEVAQTAADSRRESSAVSAVMNYLPVPTGPAQQQSATSKRSSAASLFSAISVTVFGNPTETTGQSSFSFIRKRIAPQQR